MTPGAAAERAAEPRPDVALTDAVVGALSATALERVGIAAAYRFEDTRAILFERKAAGLHGGMEFTYRNPERSTDPTRILPGAASLVVGALGYLREPPRPTERQAVAWGRVARYAWTDTYRQLADALAVGAEVLRLAGYHALVVVDDNGLVDREAASRAGIGWYGRNANLLLPGRGSWFVLGTIVTDAVLLPGTPVAPACGQCTKCLSGCPTGAIVAPGVVDARRCLSWLLQARGSFPREWRVALGDRMYGCDDCQEVCPPNHRQTAAAAQGRAAVDVADFLAPDDDAVVTAAGRWYVPDRQARYLRRNALLVLGNTADPDDPSTVRLLAAALRDADPLVRAHAVWAAARIGRPDLADDLVGTEADPVVREELDRRSEVPARVRS